MRSHTYFDFRAFESSITRPADTNAYAAGDVISAVTTNAHFTFGNTSTADTAGLVTDDAAIRVDSSGRSLTWNWLQVILDAVPATDLDGEFYLMHTDVTAVADNAADTITDAQVRSNVLAVATIPQSLWATIGSSRIIRIPVNMPLALPVTVTGQLFGRIRTNNAYTPASGGVILTRIGVTRD